MAGATIALVGASYDIVRSNLVMHLDANYTESYPGSGNTWTDLTGNGNRGTLNTSPTFTANAPASFIQFNGANQWVSITENTANMKPTILSFEIVFRYNSDVNTVGGTAPTNTQYIFFRQNSRTTNYEAYTGTLVENTNFRIISANSTGVARSTGGTTVPQIGSIYHLVGVFDTTTQSIYVNGQLEGTGNKGVLDYNANHTLKLAGAIPTGSNFQANAAINIYQVRLYDKALTADEVEQNFTAVRGRFGL